MDRFRYCSTAQVLRDELAALRVKARYEVASALLAAVERGEARASERLSAESLVAELEEERRIAAALRSQIGAAQAHERTARRMARSALEDLVESQRQASDELRRVEALEQQRLHDVMELTKLESLASLNEQSRR